MMSAKSKRVLRTLAVSCGLLGAGIAGTFSTLSAAQAPADKPPVAQPEPKKINAARSVHLRWEAPEGTDYYNEMTVEETTRGTYFMACGFAHGYFGMQELAGSRGIAGDGGKTDKVVIFSIWDTHKGDDAKAVPAEKRVELLYNDPEVRIGRFGGEGTGGQSFFTYKWKIGETCKYLVRAKPEGDKTTFSAYFYMNDKKEWKHLASFRTITGGKVLSNYYSFIEDFRRDGKSVDETRRAVYGNGWVKTTKGEWQSLDKIRFTGDRTPLNTVDAGLQADGRFYMATGGKVEQKLKLNGEITRPADAAKKPPEMPPEYAPAK